MPILRSGKFILTLFGALTMTTIAHAQDISNRADNFYKSEHVRVQKSVVQKPIWNEGCRQASLRRRISIKKTKRPAIIVGHPMGAIKEQSASLYAQKLAEHGFITLAIDLSYWGESEGKPRHLVAPEIYTDDFSAAADYLSTQTSVDPERIGILGICGSGSFAISAAKIDPRLKAVATVSMYDMGAAMRNGLRKSTTLEKRKEIIANATLATFRRVSRRQCKIRPRHREYARSRYRPSAA